MLNSIIRFSVRNKLIIGLLTLAWIVWGLIELSRLPYDWSWNLSLRWISMIIATDFVLGEEPRTLCRDSYREWRNPGDGL